MAEEVAPSFFDTNAFSIRESMIAFYEGVTGRTLQPAEVEILLFGAFAYRETVHKADCNNAALQNLAPFSTFPVLDFLAKNVGIKQRNPAQSARTTINFVLNNTHPDMVIEAGTRASHIDGSPVFAVIEDTFVPNGTDDIDILCEATDPGTFANGYSAGTITELIDPFTDFISCENTDTTAGGSEEETDEQLRERIYVAPDSFAACGPVDAYKFHALSAHPTIIDVRVEMPEIGKAYPPSGTVAIYPLTDTVPTPAVVLAAVTAACNGESARPGTDTVVVTAPTAVNYSIVAALTLYKGADDESVLSLVNDALTAFTQQKAKKLGQDIVKNQVERLCIVDGQVYDVVLSSIPSNITIAPNEFGNCTAITVTIAGYTNG
jgi:phage-related baseplate assembly protein